MDGNTDSSFPGGIAALEHLTGPSRGAVTWLHAPLIKIYLGPDRLIRALNDPPGDPPYPPVAELRAANGGFLMNAAEGRRVWVNGAEVKSQLLKNHDIIEFGDSGPMSRLVLYPENRRTRKPAAAIIGDGLSYLRLSRQPPPKRLARAFGHMTKRLTDETTLLFRIAVIAAIGVLSFLVHQQNRLNVLMTRQLESSTGQLDRFAAALARTRTEALTASDLESLRQAMSRRMTSTAERLRALEDRSTAGARVIARSAPAIAFLQGSYGYRQTSSGRMMRHVVNARGVPLISPRGKPLLTLDGDGPIAERRFTGTGFIIGAGAALLTNRHVAQPWENDTHIKALAGHGFEPAMQKFIAWFPGVKTPAALEIRTVSGDTDLAVLHMEPNGTPPTGLPLADGPPRPGDEVIVMGYPTGLRSMLAQSDAVFVESLRDERDAGFWSVAARLAQSDKIAPLASQGIVGQISDASVVYDAETTSGGSGGPVLDINGKVVAVNTAILPEYGGSNLGVPIAKIRALLKTAGVE